MIAVDCPTPERVARPASAKGVAKPVQLLTPFAAMLRACHSRHLLFEGLHRFWTAPVTPRPLAWFRIGLASVLLTQALSLIGNLEALYGRHGVVDESVRWVSPPPGVPNVQWLDQELSRVGVPAGSAVPLVFATYVVSLLGLLLGYRT